MQDDLEKLVDSIGLDQVLSILADICFAKASHVMENWQDTILAKAWERNAHVLQEAKGKLGPIA